jgi:uncharacterized protein
MQEDDIFDDSVVDIKPRKRRLWLWGALAAIVALFFFGSQLVQIYIDALWFSSVGYSEVYWLKFRLGGMLFLIFFALTFLIMRLPFVMVNRALPQLTEKPTLRFKSAEDLKEVNFLPLLYRPGVWILAAAVALSYAVSMSQAWSDFALYQNAQAAGISDPVFNHDVSFYLFKLPVLDLIASWIRTLSIILLAVVVGVSLYVSYIERVRGLGGRDLQRRTVAAISVAAAFFALTLSINTYLSRFDLLDTRHDLFTGISYTDANVRLPGLFTLALALVAAAVILVLNGLLFKRVRVIGWVAGGVAAVWLVAVLALPQAVQSFSVKPNELAKESPYIQHNINMTRAGFALDRFEEKPYQPAPSIDSRQLEANRQTLENVRLWEPQVLQSVYSQIQEIRTYYEFRLPDVDRYTIGGRKRQVMVAAREMNVEQLPEQSRNWINQHLVYTHGYGVTMSTANEFTPEGLPHMLLKNMPVESGIPELKVTRPEIYFGEVTNSHVYVKTKAQGTTQPEFNYPAGANEDSYTEYEGRAGVEVGGFFRQLALSFYLGDGTNLLFSDYITSDSRVLIRRGVLDRVRQIAPFLLFDSDPYIVINREGKLFWMIDAFTHSDRYPYSTAYQVTGRNVNYLRNSVKVVIDAYDGDVKFYVFDPADPLIRSYQSVFPSLFVAASDMPEDLLSHIRYPEMFAATQARAYAIYHMTSSQTFYNREDLWAIPSTEVGDQKSEPTPMEPYYVLIVLPGEKDYEFLSILPFTPAGKGRNNMIGWMAARSDPGIYGHTLVYTFPKNVTVSGPAQIRARVNQDPQLSAQMTLWNQQGSQLLRGSLQVIPIADSLLYIEPFYLQAVNSPLPELRQVAIATQDRLAAAETFDAALKELFSQLGQKPAEEVATQQPASAPTVQPGASKPVAAAAAGDIERLARQAQQLLSDYERLSAAGKHREAGEKLDQLKQTISEMNRKQSGG